MKKLILILFILTSICSYSQKEENIWYFGLKAGVDFNVTPPVGLDNSAMWTSEGCATISDQQGNLLFYTNGVTIWNKNHVTMSGGTGLAGGLSSTQSALIIRDPGCVNQYYIFTVADQSGLAPLAYTLVDITLDGGLGAVISGKENIVLSPLSISTEKLTATVHANGRDIWIVMHEWGTNNFMSYLVTPSGISNPVISPVGFVHQDIGGFQVEVIGNMVISNSAKKLAVAVTNLDPKGLLEILDFNNTTGIVTNPISFYGIRSYGVAFSPDDSKLYLNGYDIDTGISIKYGLVQYDISSGDSLLITNSYYVIDSFTGQNVKLATDGKIYANSSNKLSVIEFPNLPGVSCGYQKNLIDLKGKSAAQSLPNVSIVTPVFPIEAGFNFNLLSCFSQDSILFSNTSAYDTTAPVMWSWNFDDPGSGGNNSSSLQDPIHQFSDIGTYMVTLIIEQNCVFDTVVSIVTVANNNTINANFDYTKNCHSDTVFFFNTSLYDTTKQVNWLWNFGNDIYEANDTSILKSPFYIYEDIGSYLVKLIASDNCNTDSILKTVYVNNSCEGDVNSFFLPNVISPNGDGQNDFLHIIGNNIKSVQIKIYNNQGEKVFESKNSKFKWDGKFGNEKIINSTYVYNLDIEFINGEYSNQTGNLLIIQ